MESSYRVTSVRRWLPAGPISAGGHRKDDLIQFVAYKSGLRTVAVRDIIEIR